MHSSSKLKKQTIIMPKINMVSQFDFLSDDYKTLFEQSNATIFQSPFWLDSLYRKLPEFLDAEAVIVTMHDETKQQLLMVMPFVRQTKFGGKIMQPADLGISDYNSIIVLPEALDALKNQKDLSAQLKQAIGPFDILLFRKQRPCLLYTSPSPRDRG